MQLELPQSLPRVHYSFSCEATPDRLWLVRRVELVEALSQPYRLIVELRSDPTELDVDALLLADAELVFDREVELRTVCGVITRVELFDPVDDEVALRVEVQPALALLDQRVDTRLWPYTTARRVVEGILAETLGDYGREVELGHLLDTWRSRPGVAQYRESDLAVIARLLEDEGFAYHFDHERGTGREVLVLENSADHWEQVPTSDGDGVVPVIDTRHDQAEVESLQRLCWTRAIRPNAVARQITRADHPSTPERVEARVAGEGPPREVYQHSRREEDSYDDRIARELAVARTGGRVLTGVGNVIGFAPGRRFKVDPSCRPELAELEFLITRVVTRGDCPEVELDAGASEDPFRNEFECVVLDGEPWRPPRATPIPRIHGPVTGIVTGPEGEEIHVDSAGRVKVRLEWDRVHDLHDDETSMWIRVAQGWAGAGFGQLFIPRVGMEVVVEFLAGDPARPLITGCVYNADAEASVALPEHATQSTIRTRSSPGGRGYNELRFEDAAGREELFVHAQRNLREVVGCDHVTTIAGDRRETVEGDVERTVTGKQTVTIGGELVQIVKGTHSYDYEEPRSVTVWKQDALHVLGTASREYRQGLSEAIGGAQQVTITPTETEGASLEVAVAGPISQVADDWQRLHGKVGVEVSQGTAGSPAAAVALSESNVGVTGEDVSISARSNGSISAAKLLELRANGGALLRQGSAVIELANETIEIQARNIELSVGASKISITPNGVTITGTVVQIN